VGIADQVGEYFEALIVGVILLYVLYEVVMSVFSNMPIIASYGTTLIVAAVIALVAIAKRGIK